MIAAGVIIVVVIAINAGHEEAAEVLLECHAGFSRYACWVGIDGPEEILDLLLNIPLIRDLRTVRCGDLP